MSITSYRVIVNSWSKALFAIILLLSGSCDNTDQSEQKRYHSTIATLQSTDDAQVDSVADVLDSPNSSPAEAVGDGAASSILPAGEETKLESITATQPTAIIGIESPESVSSEPVGKVEVPDVAPVTGAKPIQETPIDEGKKLLFFIYSGGKQRSSGADGLWS